MGFLLLAKANFASGGGGGGCSERQTYILHLYFVNVVNNVTKYEKTLATQQEIEGAITENQISSIIASIYFSCHYYTGKLI